jgi:hypothetical protein
MKEPDSGVPARQDLVAPRASYTRYIVGAVWISTLIILAVVAPLLGAFGFDFALRHGWAQDVSPRFLLIFPFWLTYAEQLDRFGVDINTIKTVLFELSVYTFLAYFNILMNYMYRNDD